MVTHFGVNIGTIYCPYLDNKSFPWVVTEVAREMTTQGTHVTGVKDLAKVCRTTPGGLNFV